MPSRKASGRSPTRNKAIAIEDAAVQPTPMTTNDDSVTEFLSVGFLQSIGLPDRCVAGTIVADKKLKSEDDDSPNARHIQFKLGGVIFGFSCVEGDDPFEGQADVEVEIISIEPNVATRRAQAKVSSASTQSAHVTH